MCLIGSDVPENTQNCFKLVKKISSVLNIIGITTFFHVRINKGNNIFVLSNNEDINEHFITKMSEMGTFFWELAGKSVSGRILVALWMNYKEDTFLQKIYEFGIGNGISITLPFQDYIDIFSFATSVENTTINNFYLNHIRLLKRFIIFFRLRAKKAIDYAQDNLMFELSDKIQLYDVLDQKKQLDVLRHLRQQVLPRKLSMKTRGVEKTTLTKRETECLVLLLEGKSMRLIANELHLSQRTIESHLEAVKLKTGYHTKTMLLSAFLESQIFQPSIHYDRYY